MNERDQELLDKQLWGVSPGPPRSGGRTGVAFIAVFLVGIAIGAILFARESTRTETSSHLVTATLSLLNGMPPTAR